MLWCLTLPNWFQNACAGVWQIPPGKYVLLFDQSSRNTYSVVWQILYAVVDQFQQNICADVWQILCAVVDQFQQKYMCSCLTNSNRHTCAVVWSIKSSRNICPVVLVIPEYMYWCLTNFAHNTYAGFWQILAETHVLVSYKFQHENICSCLTN